MSAAERKLLLFIALRLENLYEQGNNPEAATMFRRLSSSVHREQELKKARKSK